MTPEQYWINRGEDVIGTDVLREGLGARQGKVYRAIALWIMGHHVKDVLDVGCNIAALEWFLRESGYTGEYIGIDSNAHALSLADLRIQRQAERRSWLLNYNLRHIRYDGESRECVVVKDVIEHLETPELLSEAFRVAAKYVIVSTYIPWTATGEARIVRHGDGYYTNRYRLEDILHLTLAWGFRRTETAIVAETNGTPNQINIFERQVRHD